MSSRGVGRDPYVFSKLAGLLFKNSDELTNFIYFVSDLKKNTAAITAVTYVISIQATL